MCETVISVLLLEALKMTYLSRFRGVARKQEIIKITEQLIEAVNNGDFEAYT